MVGAQERDDACPALTSEVRRVERVPSIHGLLLWFSQRTQQTAEPKQWVHREERRQLWRKENKRQNTDR